MHSILAQPSETLVKLAEHPLASHVLEKALTNDTADMPFKRKFVTLLDGSFARLATNSAGSHVVDACAVATLTGMNNYRQRIATELAANEAELRDSFFGRAVWRNWKMDIYNTRKSDWLNMGKNGVGKDERAQATGEKPKTALQVSSLHKTLCGICAEGVIKLASERHSAKKAKGDVPAGLSGANATKRKHEGIAA